MIPDSTDMHPVLLSRLHIHHWTVWNELTVPYAQINTPFKIPLPPLFLHVLSHMNVHIRVGSHVVFAWIHCTDIRIHCTDIQIEFKQISLCLLIYTQKVIHHFPAHIFPIKHYQDIVFKLLTLSTNSVTKKIIVVRTAYFYNSGLIFAAKRIVTESVLKVRSFMRISWHR